MELFHEVELLQEMNLLPELGCAHLHPGHEGEQEEEDDGGDLPAGQHLPRLLPELHVHQEDRHRDGPMSLARALGAFQVLGAF